MEYVLPGAFLFLLTIVLLLNLLTLPANWIMVGLVFMWRFANPHPGSMDMWYFVSVVGLAVLGEVSEFVAQAWGTKKYGSSNTGMVAGIIGAIVGAVLGVPFFFGLGALVGALMGAWLGCYGMERLRGRTDTEAMQAAKGALVGRFLGIVIKCGIGVIMLVLTYHAIWPEWAVVMPIPAEALPNVTEF